MLDPASSAITDDQISEFFAFTGSSDTNAAIQYLEMSGNNLEMAVGLFLEHGAADGIGSTLGGGAGGASSGEGTRGNPNSSPHWSNSDEELATSMAVIQYSNIDQPTLHAPTQSPPQASSNSRSKRCRVASGVLLILATVVIVMATLLPQRISSEGFDLLDPSTWFPHSQLDGNPHGGNSPYDFNRWNNQNSCRGIDLDIIDNLDSKWGPYFQQSINDWEAGSPDVLSLSVYKSRYSDPKCEASINVIKVCNGDYGATDWVGINNVAIQYGFIISSVALMNDYYLDDSNEAQKQNTMCHELGHGFGLGHWDENFYNKDLGNCMDYTNSPENNQRPDESNFLFLEQMYGNVDGTSQYVRAGVNVTEGLYCTSTSTNKDDIFKQRRLQNQSNLSSAEFAQYASLMTPDQAVVAESIYEDHPLAHFGWRYLKRSKSFEIHERDVGGGIKIVSTIKLA